MVAINENSGFYAFSSKRGVHQSFRINVRPGTFYQASFTSYTGISDRAGNYTMTAVNPLGKDGNRTSRLTAANQAVATSASTVAVDITKDQELGGKVVTVEEPLDNLGLYIVAHDEARKILHSLEKLGVLSRIGQPDLAHPRVMIEGILEQNVINAVEAVAKRWGSAGNVGGQITVSAFLKDEKLNLQVSDNGLGFPEALIHEIGKRPFTRTSDLLTDKHRLEGGIENHLYLTNERIKEFGWELNVENLPDGASVSIVIPLC